MICLRLSSALKSIVLLYKVVTNFTIYCVMGGKGWDAVFHCDLRYVLCELLYVKVFGILIMLQSKKVMLSHTVKTNSDQSNVT